MAKHMRNIMHAYIYICMYMSDEGFYVCNGLTYMCMFGLMMGLCHKLVNLKHMYVIMSNHVYQMM